jgi:acetyl-CoA carboxylase biotin carboxyl carrier protein
MSRIPSGPDGINLLIDLLEQRNLQEIEIEENNCRIRIVRASAPLAASVAPSALSPRSEPRNYASSDEPSAPEAYIAGLLRSDMVGIAFLSAAPESPAFVRVGGRVEAGQTLLLIEAMKVFHKVNAPYAGTVQQIFIESGEMVDYG